MLQTSKIKKYRENYYSTKTKLTKKDSPSRELCCTCSLETTKNVY